MVKIDPSQQKLGARKRLGKYRIEGKIGEGGSANVYRAYDTIEGIRVALKLPSWSGGAEVLELFRREVRLTAQLDHPNILPLKNASFIDDYFVIVTPLGDESLAERLTRRISVEVLVDLTDQLIAALSHAHDLSILHCDLKPENVLLFPENRLRLSDFGVARVAYQTVEASGSGTIGSMAPEQALGKPSLRSDVFALGLVLYKMFTGHTPEYPFEWPYPGREKLFDKLPPEMVSIIRKCLEPNPRNRFADACEVEERFVEILPEIESHLDRRRKRAQRKRARGKRARRR